MTTPQLTLSALWRAAICPGSAALPHVRTRDVPGSALGNALHKVQELRARGERPDLDAIADAYAVPADDRGWYFATARRCLPVIPAGAFAEIALAYNPETGRVSRIPPPDDSHRYDVPSTWLPGMLDLAWLESRTACMTDYKSGDEDNVAPPDRNYQIRIGAFMWARYSGMDRALGSICYLEPPPEGETSEGRWEMGSVIDAAGLDAIELELRDVLHRIETARFDVAAGAVPELVTGDHCTHCPARTGCPAHLAEVRAMVIGQTPTLCLIGQPLTRDEYEWVANRIASVKAVVAKAEEGLKHASDVHGPVVLASGKVYEGKDETREAIDVGIAIPVLVSGGYPDPVAALSTSKSAIGDMIAADFRARGAKGAAAKKREVLAAIDSAGGITRSTVRIYKARHGGKVLPVANGTPELEDLGPLDD